MEKIKPESFEGKTIAKIDNSCVNTLEFHFTDGTSIIVWTEHVGHGFYGFRQSVPEEKAERVPCFTPNNEIKLIRAHKEPHQPCVTDVNVIPDMDPFFTG